MTKKRDLNSETAAKASVEIGKMLRDARLKQGLSQSDVSRLMGYSNAQYISDWERARSPVPMNKLVQVAKVLGIDADKLFDLFVAFSVKRLKTELNTEYRALTKKRSK